MNPPPVRRPKPGRYASPKPRTRPAKIRDDWDDPLDVEEPDADGMDEPRWIP